jgi:hypothetical protein
MLLGVAERGGVRVWQRMKKNETAAPSKTIG